MDDQVPDQRLDAALARFLRVRGDEIEAATMPPAHAAARARRAPISFASRHLAWIALGTLLLVTALLVTLVVASRPLRTPGPVGRNGLIGYSLADLTSLPYDTVHLVREDGTADRPIGEGIGQTFSMDGRVLAYWQGPSPDAILTVSAPDGTAARSVPGIPGRAPIALSPDGTSLAWLRKVGDRMVVAPSGALTTGSLDNELWVSPLDGGPGRRIIAVDQDPAGRSYSSPTWSPDGRWIAFLGTTDVAYDHGPRFMDGALSDGAGSEARGYGSAVFIVRPDGSGLRQVSAHPGSEWREIGWSPDGRSIAFSGWQDGTPMPSVPPAAAQPSTWPDWVESVGRPFDPEPQGLFVVDIDDEAEHAVASGLTFGGGLAWSGDGQYLAFQTAGEESHIAVVAMDGPDPIGGPIIGPASSGDFAWSPDARQILFSWHGPYDSSTGHRIPKAVLETTIQTIPADLQGSPTPVLVVPHEVDRLAWQWLAP